MKKSKYVLLLPAACLLCSCGSSEPGSDFKEIKKEDVSAKAKAIETKVGEDSFKLPTKLTYTASISATGKMTEKFNGGARGDGKVVIDTENNYLYGSFGGILASELEESTTNLETWLYQDSDSFIIAAAFGEKKEYMKVESASVSEAYNSYSKAFSLDLDSIKSAVKEMTTSISNLVVAASIDASASTSAGGMSVEAKFYSKGDGDLKATAKASVSTSEESYTSEGTYVIANYLPAYTYMNVTGKMDGADYSLEQKSLYEWNKADTSSKPNLKDFTERKGQ